MQKLFGRLKKISTSTSNFIDKYEVLKYAVAALILVIPIYPKFPFISVGGTYVSVRLEDFLMALVVAIWAVRSLPYVSNIFKNKIGQAIIIFWVVTLVSVISAIFLTKTVDYHVGVLHWARRIEYMITFFIGLTAVRSRKDLEFYIKTTFVVILVVFIFGIGQKFFDWPIITTQNQEYAKGIALRYMPGGHLPSTFAGHYDLAAYIILTSPVLFAFMLSPKFKDWKVKGFIFLFVAMSFWLLVETISRTALVSYVLSITLLMIFVKQKKFIPILWLSVFILAGMSSDLIGRYTSILDAILKKLKLAFGTRTVYAADAPVASASPAPTPAPAPFAEDRSSSIRFNVEWPRAIRALTKNPLMGTGFSSITLATDNDFLRLLGEVGLTGFLAFFLIFKRLFSSIVVKIKSLDITNTGDLFFLAIATAIPGIFLDAVFIDIFESSKFAIIFWLMLGFGVAAISHDKAHK